MPTNFPSSPSNGDTYIPPQIQKLLASDAASNDSFGYSVALSSDGNTAVIGSYLEDTTATDQGAAYIFTRTSGTWTQQAKLLASDAAANDIFGYTVSISLDGNTAIIGATSESTSPNTTNGAAYVFTRSGTTWTQQQKLLASDRANDDQFGYSVALSPDGNTAIIGAQYEDTTPNTDNGAAYVFTRSAGVWTEQQKLTASDAASNALFGWSVALSSDGNTAIVGSIEQSESPLSSNGAAYVFIRSAGVWTQQQKLLASDRAVNDYFGYSVALSADGNTAIISSRDEDTSPTIANGAAYVFTRSGTTWTQQQKLLASDRETGAVFGWSVSVSGNGNTALIGAVYEDNTSLDSNQGAAYLFTRSAGAWTQQAKLTASDAMSDDYFGQSVALSFDGNIALIGAYSEDTSTNTDQGAVYSYTFGGTGTQYVYNSTLQSWTISSSVPKKAPTTHLFTSSVSSWTIPSNAKVIHAVVIAGGGGGGGGGDDTPGGAGGGGGGISVHTYNLISGYNTTAVITVGAGGAGGNGGGTNNLGSYILGTAGTTGGTSGFRIATSGNLGTLDATGGSGGGTASSSTSTTATTGGAGGTGMWSGGAGASGGSGLTSTTNNGVSATATTSGFAPGGGGGGGGTYNLTNTGNGGAGASALTIGSAVGTAISKTDANINTLGTNSPVQFVNNYYPAKTPPAVIGPGGGGNGAPSGGYMVTPSSALGYYGGTGGLYGGGGGGGGTTPSGSGDDAFGGNGGAGSQGCVFLTVWYE